MRKAFMLCDTPYQIINGLNIIRNMSDIQFDLYIINQFESALTVFTNISISENISNVVLIRRSKSILFNHIKDYTDYMFPKLVYKKIILNSKKEILNFKYDLIMASVLTREACVMSYINPNADFYLYDDGNGSYSGNITLDTINPCKYKLYKVLKVGPPNVTIKGLYVNNSMICQSTITSNIIQMPKITESYLKYLDAVFGEKERNSERKIIWLTTPNELKNDITKVDNDIMNSLKKHQKDVIIRIHPRQNDKNRFEGFILDNSKRPWELSIASPEINNKVLIGMFSTAQLTPKFIFNNEPFLIFTYPCYKECLKEIMYEKMEKNINELKKIYSEPQKIKVAYSADDIEIAINEWMYC